MKKYGTIRSRDIFEDICAGLGCDVTSSIKYGSNLAKAEELLKTMNIKQYPLRQISDICDYIFGEKKVFESYEEAKKAIDEK